MEFNRLENVKLSINNYDKGRPELLGTYLENELLKGEEAFIGEIPVTLDGKFVIDFKNVYSGIMLGDCGMGKTYLLHNIITQLLLLNSAEDLEIVIMDVKEGNTIREFEKLKQVKRYNYSLVSYDNVCSYLEEEIEKRENVNEKYPELFIVVDELHFMLYQLSLDSKYHYGLVLGMLQKVLLNGKDLGIHLIMVGQAREEIVNFLVDDSDLKVLFKNEYKVGNELLGYPLDLEIESNHILYTLTNLENAVFANPVIIEDRYPSFAGFCWED